jgi:hypothetical protein
MKPKVYIETTIPSYLTAWQSRKQIRAEDQQTTREWWAMREAFELYVSELVLAECRAGDPIAALDRLAALHGLAALSHSAEADKLAEALMFGVPLPEMAAADALHIALASIHGMQYLLTWNCSHIANPVLRPQIEAVCREAGYEPPLICTPKELTQGGIHND